MKPSLARIDRDGCGSPVLRYGLRLRCLGLFFSADYHEHQESEGKAQG